MKVTVRPEFSPAVQLEDAENLRELSVAVPRWSDKASVNRALQHDEVGTASADVEHVQLSVEWLRSRGQVGQSTDWLAQFEKMLEFAAAKGWLSEDRSMVQAHVVQQ